MSNNIEIINRKASFNYEFIDTYVAGIVLEGFEIVAIKIGQINISEAYCYFSGNELFLKNAIISRNEKNEDWMRKKPSTFVAKAANRDRKLLLNKSELRKIFEQVKIKGLTVVPYKVFINEKRLCKVLIAVAKGKKTYDKRNTLKERDIAREAKKELL